jgi:serine/threonine protein kinase
MQVKHENIIGMLGICMTPTKVFIVTEYASGGELLDRQD